jgi:hypothetical protein
MQKRGDGKYFMIVKLKLEKKKQITLCEFFVNHDEKVHRREMKEKWNLWNFHHEFKSKAASLHTLKSSQVSSLSHKFTFTIYNLMKLSSWSFGLFSSLFFMSYDMKHVIIREKLRFSVF